MFKKNSSSAYFILPAFCMALFAVSIQAQRTTTNSVSTKPGSNKNTCGCDYLPLCNWEQTKVFAGKTFKGYADEQGEMEWYNCENGVVTKKWTENFYPEQTSHSYDPFDKEWTIHTTTGPAQKVLQTQIILKYNLPEGSKWSQEVTEQGGFINTHYWTIEKKGLTINIDNVSYTNVIKVRYSTKANDLYNVPGFFYYYAKGEGLIKKEIEPKKEQKTIIREEIAKTETALKKAGAITGSIDKELAGKWQLPSTNKQENPLFMDLEEDGIGSLYYETTDDDQIFQDFKNMLTGKKTISKTYFIWRVDNGMRIIWLDEFLKVKKTNTYKLTRLIDPASKKPAIKVANDTYIAITKTKWQTQVEEPFTTESQTRKLKGIIDPSIVGKWKHDIPQGGGKFTSVYYTFKQDGSFEYTIPPSILYDKNKFNGHWRVDGDFIELMQSDGEPKIERTSFKKINDPRTGKPKIVIGYLGQGREYESEDNKKQW